MIQDVNIAKIRNNNPFVSMFIEAGTNITDHTDDFNGEDQEGIGRYQVTQKNGRRWSTAAAYLNPARARPNLTILTETTVDKVIFENKTAKAVKCLINGVPEEIRCAKKFYYVEVHMAPLLYFKDLELEIELFLVERN